MEIIFFSKGVHLQIITTVYKTYQQSFLTCQSNRSHRKKEHFRILLLQENICISRDPTLFVTIKTEITAQEVHSS